MQFDILLVEEDLPQDHFSTATVLWNGVLDVQLFAEVYVETKNITSRVCNSCYLALVIYEEEIS